MDGIIILNKPSGMTSSNCVVKARKILKIKKIGHTGTLDPNVSGVLPLAIGKATKLVDYLTSKEKTYEAEFIMGIQTDTDDITGKIINKKIPLNVSPERIDQILETFLGKSIQTPSIYSAIKVNGKKLYEYARNNKEVSIPKREIEIYEIKRTSDICFKENKLFFNVLVSGSKGFYVRTIAHDFGIKIGIPTTLGNMTRTRSGNFLINDSYSFSDLENNTYKLIKIEEIFKDKEEIIVSDYLAKLVKNGIILDERQIKTNDYFRVYDKNKNLLAIYYVNGINDYRPLIIF